MLKKIIKIVSAVIVVLIVVVLVYFWRDANTNKYKVSADDVQIPKFTQVNLDWHHLYNSKKSLPIAPSALIDMDNDYVDELFFGGGLGQDDALFAFRNGAFVNISDEVEFPTKDANLTSLSVASADFNNDGKVDLIVGREDGLHLYINDGKTFKHQRIQALLDAKSTPAGITLGDINKDGYLDIFLSTYLKKELMEGQTIFTDPNYGSISALLLNDGNNNFTNITKRAGLTYIHNTFQGVLVDIDNDSWLDLIVAHDTGEVRTYKNNGNLTFTMINNPLTNQYAYPMGIAVGDYNNDGLVDFMFSNTGSTLPRFLSKGDIEDVSKFNEKWILFKNEGDFVFTDAAEEAKIANYEFSWGCVFADMNNDGLLDLMVAENYVDLLPNKLFRLPGRFLLQKPNNTFVPTEAESGVVNPHFGITPLVSDFNLDGYLDFVWTNIDSPSLAYISQGGNQNFVQIALGDNHLSQGARIEVKTATKTLTDWLVSGEGLASDQTALIHFGLGNEQMMESLRITFANDSTVILYNLKANRIIEVAQAYNAAVQDSLPNAN